jgi:hypothetical protein
VERGIYVSYHRPIAATDTTSLLLDLRLNGRPVSADGHPLAVMIEAMPGADAVAHIPASRLDPRFRILSAGDLLSLHCRGELPVEDLNVVVSGRSRVL